MIFFVNFELYSYILLYLPYLESRYNLKNYEPTTMLSFTNCQIHYVDRIFNLFSNTVTVIGAQVSDGMSRVKNLILWVFCDLEVIMFEQLRISSN